MLNLQCLCEWSGAAEPLKGQSIPLDYAFVEIVSPYADIHYEIVAADFNPTFEDEE